MDEWILKNGTPCLVACILVLNFSTQFSTLFLHLVEWSDMLIALKDSRYLYVPPHPGYL